MFLFLKRLFGSQQQRILARYQKVVQKINQYEEGYASLSDEQLKEKTVEFKQRLADGETTEDLLPEAYAVVKSASRRLCGQEIHVSGYDQKWDMIPYDVQLLGAIAMHSGSIAEMQTGEGKTLTATLPLYLHALTGKPVHLVTVNDYLATRDCEWTGSILRFLGITTAALTNATPVPMRRDVYAHDVVYGTASEFGFDYLRDNSSAMRKEEKVQRGFYFSMIDEVDSVLIDEARTPLIISGPVPVSRQMFSSLKDNVASLVKQQKLYCGALATKAQKELQTIGLLNTEEEQSWDKAATQAITKACHSLWLVTKGAPRNKTLKKLLEHPDVRAEVDNWDLHYYSDQNKQEKHQVLSELLMVVDEKANEYELTDKGIQTWASLSDEDTADDFLLHDLAEEYLKIDEDSTLSEEEKLKKKTLLQNEDEKQKERAHNLRQLLRAHLLMEANVDYIIDSNKIVIVDENTGRPQPGRRFSDGLHQAIEAKEGVEIQRETQTYATITLQNYFRMYDRLAGMTGTATTEAGEFKEIYKLQVLEIPTHLPGKRKDFNDEVYMSEREKYAAILKEIAEIHKQGRPILVGTDSVVVSEKLSRILRMNKIPHNVLNAKYHEKEAEIIANAGQRGAVTLATNMAGRGTDIKLGEGITDIGGLYVIGTTRHHSRRIDRQLRGRTARQGDPGSSKFYICFEDQLMRLFGSPKWTALLQKLRPPEGEPISASILNRSIETAQKRVEQKNYAIRKHTLEYDDVMNVQRKELYRFRNDILDHDDIVVLIAELITSMVLEKTAHYLPEDDRSAWQPQELQQWLVSHFPVSFSQDLFDPDLIDPHTLGNTIAERVVAVFHEKIHLHQTILRQAEAPPEALSNTLRALMLNIVDRLWQEHLLVMDNLRSEVQLRSFGQRDPLTEYKHDAFDHFDRMTAELRSEVTTLALKFEIVRAQPSPVQQALQQSKMTGPTSSSIESALPQQAPPQPQQPTPVKSVPLAADPKVGRNDDCPCGSGRKYKKCCGKQEAVVD